MIVWKKSGDRQVVNVYHGIFGSRNRLYTIKWSKRYRSLHFDNCKYIFSPPHVNIIVLPHSKIEKNMRSWDDICHKKTLLWTDVHLFPTSQHSAPHESMSGIAVKTVRKSIYKLLWSSPLLIYLKKQLLFMKHRIIEKERISVASREFIKWARLSVGPYFSIKLWEKGKIQMWLCFETETIQ